MKTIKRYVGDIKPFTILARNKRTRSPIDITGCAIMISVKESDDDLDSEALYYNADVPHVNETSGLARTDEVTFNWAPGQYIMQVRIIDAAAQVTSSEKANLVLEQSNFKPA